MQPLAGRLTEPSVGANKDTLTNKLSIGAAGYTLSRNWFFGQTLTPYQIDFNTGSSGNPITLAAPITAITGSPVYSVTSAHGALSMRASDTTATSCIRVDQGVVTTHSGSMYFRLGGSPGTDIVFASFSNTSNAATCGIRIKSGSRVLSLVDSSNTDVATGTITIPFNQWVRIDWQFDNSSPGAPSLSVRLYLSSESSVASFNDSLTWQFTQTTNLFARISYGIIGTGNSTIRDVIIDTIRNQSGLSWIGPFAPLTPISASETWAMVITEALSTGLFTSTTDTSAVSIADAATLFPFNTSTLAVRSSSTSGATTQSTSATVSVPTGAAIGDIAVFCIEVDQSGDSPGVAVPITWPSGFTEKVSLANGEMKQKVAWKRLTAADTGTYVASWTGSKWYIAHAVLVSGAVSTGDPFEVFNTATSTANPIPSVSVTTTIAGLLLYIVTNLNTSTLSGLSGYTTIVDAPYNHFFYQIQGTSGAASVSGATLSNATTPRAVSLLSIMPDTTVAATPITGTDTASVSIAETVLADASSTRTDTASVSIADISTNAATVSRADTAAVSIADIITADSTLSRSDTASVSIADSMLTAALVLTTDGGAVSIADTSSLSSFLSTTDQASITITDTSALTYMLLVSDTGAISIADSILTASTLSVVDTSSVSIADISAALISLALSDGYSVAIADSSASLATLSVSESPSISISDIVTIISGLSVVDSTGVSVADTINALIPLSVSDTSSVSIADVIVITLANAISVSDTASISIAEASSPQVVVATADAWAVIVAETAATNVTLSRTDTAALTITDSSGALISFGVSENTALSVADSAGTGLVLSASDTASIAIGDSITTSALLSVMDSVGLSVADTIALQSLLSTSDTTSVQISETALIELLLAINVTDASALSISDVAGTDIVLSTSDTTALHISDTVTTGALGSVKVLHVYVDGQWKQAVMKVYVNGTWKTINIRIRTGDVWL